MKTISRSFLEAYLIMSGLAMAFVILYVVKSRMGIDLVKGSSPFPQFLKGVGVCH